MISKNDLQRFLNLDEIQDVEFLDKGFSDDKKYIIKTRCDKFLLRMTALKNKARMIQMIDLLKQAEVNNIPSHKIIEHGEYNESDYYMLTSWIEGSDTSEVLPTLPKKEQYNIGVEAGRMLKDIHNFDVVSSNHGTWEERFNRKIDKKIKDYSTCDLKLEHGDLFIDAVEKRRDLLKGIKVVQHHGDFHINNMLIDNEGLLYIIDFDRHDSGDPYEEFNRITWCADVSPQFASGRIDGYFDFKVPEKFWDLLILYISNNTLSALPWSIPYGADQIEIMRSQAKDILTWYDHFNHKIPSWYVGKK